MDATVWILSFALVIGCYFLRRLMYRGVDEIENAITRKKNAENTDNTDDLANRYKH